MKLILNLFLNPFFLLTQWQKLGNIKKKMLNELLNIIVIHILLNKNYKLLLIQNNMKEIKLLNTFNLIIIWLNIRLKLINLSNQVE